MEISIEFSYREDLTRSLETVDKALSYTGASRGRILAVCVGVAGIFCSKLAFRSLCIVGGGICLGIRDGVMVISPAVSYISSIIQKNKYDFGSTLNRQLFSVSLLVGSVVGAAGEGASAGKEMGNMFAGRIIKYTCL